METSETPPGDPTAAGAVDLASTNPYSLHKAVHARREEYIRNHRLRIKVGTWNIAACPGTDKDLARWFIDGEGLDPALAPSTLPKDGLRDGAAETQERVPALSQGSDYIQ